MSDVLVVPSHTSLTSIMNAFLTLSSQLLPKQSLNQHGKASRKCRRCISTRSSMDSVDISPNREPAKPTLFNIITSSAFEVLNPPPPPVVLARRTLDKDFAVLLMRAGYNVVDELDFVPMDEFQAQFFEIRSTEWEKFIQTNLGMRQGILTDPRYFDFISYAQMLTIQFFIRDPRTLFQERYGDENGNWGTRVIHRDVDRLEAPQDILYAWRLDIGKIIYQRLQDTVRRPKPATPGDGEAIIRGISDIYDYLEIAGFCLKTNVSRERAGPNVLRVELVAPCILWGSKALRRRKSIPNDYDCFAVEAFCSASGAQASYTTLFSENSLTRLWTITGTDA